MSDAVRTQPAVARTVQRGVQLGVMAYLLWGFLTIYWKQLAAFDAFELIAREGRKYGLILCLATQRPRDLTEGVLSQMGAMIVHRLTNAHDRDVVERASGDLDRRVAAFLPTLAPGEAVLVGADIPIPLTIHVQTPKWRPRSTGPQFSTCTGDGHGI